MVKLKEEETKIIKGGIATEAIVVGIGLLIIFIIGIVDGLTRPQACRK